MYSTFKRVPLKIRLKNKLIRSCTGIYKYTHSSGIQHSSRSFSNANDPNQSADQELPTKSTSIRNHPAKSANERRNEDEIKARENQQMREKSMNPGSTRGFILSIGAILIGSAVYVKLRRSYLQQHRVSKVNNLNQSLDYIPPRKDKNGKEY